MSLGRAAYEAREAELGSEMMRQLERLVMLRVVDTKWMAHLDAMDDLREGVGLRAFGQKDPLTEYKLEAFDMFNEMISTIKDEVVRMMFKVKIERRVETPEERTGVPTKAEAARLGAGQPAAAGAGGGRGVIPGLTPMASGSGPAGGVAASGGGGVAGAASAPGSARGTPGRPGARRKMAPVVKGPKVGRNDPCPCGSGKKYKKCCGKVGAR